MLHLCCNVPCVGGVLCLINLCPITSRGSSRGSLFAGHQNSGPQQPHDWLGEAAAGRAGLQQRHICVRIQGEQSKLTLRRFICLKRFLVLIVLSLVTSQVFVDEDFHKSVMSSACTKVSFSPLTLNSCALFYPVILNNSNPCSAFLLFFLQCILENVDLSVPVHISVQTLGSNGLSSNSVHTTFRTQH